MNIIFLDIDGVLCTIRSHLAYGDGLLMCAWDITCCQMIRKLCKKYDCKLVISSTWRKGTDRQNRLSTYLCVYGLVEHMYSSVFDSEDWKTPICREYKPHECRGTEIALWLQQHPDIKHYIIIDDDTDMLQEQLPYFIKTDSDEGFSSANYMAIEDLCKKWSSLHNIEYFI